MRRIRGTFSSVIFLFAFAWTAPIVMAQALTKFDLPTQPLADSLRSVGSVTNTNILFDPPLVAGHTAPALKAEATVEQALTRLLVGTGIKHEFLNETTVVLTRIAAPAVDSKKAKDVGPQTKSLAPVSEPSRMAQADSKQNQDIENTNVPDSKSKDSDKSKLEEIIVTGTNIRGGESASPVLVFTQEDIVNSGAATAQEFFATLPQNFAGGQTDLNYNSPAVPTQADFSFGNSVNLRGLGSDSTLVLINGHRSALGGTAQYTDISAIPMSAVERIEVLTDGASAIYGSDAIGGVVNFIMRKDYEGVDTRIRGGTTTQGGGTEYQMSQDFGTKWDSGSVLLNYDFTRREQINSTQREYTSRFNSIYGDYNLDPDQKTQNVFLTAQQNLSERTAISTDFLFSDRYTAYKYYDDYGVDYAREFSSNQLFAGSVDLTYQLDNSWQTDINGGASRYKTGYTDHDPGSTGGYGDYVGLSKYDIGYADAKATGTVVDLPSGPAKLAVGASYRKESYTLSLGVTSLPPTIIPESSFDVRAEYAELLIPLLGGTQSRPATQRLLLTLAARHEEYSNFGGTTNPKAGIRWAALESVQFRGTYGTSFKAPSLFQASDFNADYFIANVTLPSGQVMRVIERGGSNPDLKPQTAKTWTFGVDFSPDSIRGLKGHLTYYDIVYKGQIESATYNPTAWLTDPAYAGIRTVRGSIPDSEFNALAEALLSNTNILSYGCATGTQGYVPCAEPVQDISAIVDDRLLNLAGSRTNGLDFTVDQRIEPGVGVVQLGLNASYMFHIYRQFTEAAPAADLVNTVFNPLRLRLRALATWTVGPWNITGVTNFANKYTNDVSVPESSMASWTTMDLNIRYGFGGRASTSVPANTSVALNITNVFDKNPPYLIYANFPNLGYDSTNANPYGRMTSVAVTHKW
jgi:iron complex outermembrane receptor protein